MPGRESAGRPGLAWGLASEPRSSNSRTGGLEIITAMYDSVLSGGFWLSMLDSIE